MTDYPEWFLLLVQSIKSKRPRIVAQHLLEHGSITTEELSKIYGYEHPPRAARDLRELGIPLETFRVKNAEGRSIAAYRFADLSQVRLDRAGGRKNISKAFKQQLAEIYGQRCNICRGTFELRELQVDHRVPYEIVTDSEQTERDPSAYMLLCGACNRAKSWSCEHCINWREAKQAYICLHCYWGSPEAYQHIALREVRRVDILWNEGEIELYESVKHEADARGISVADYIKRSLQEG